MRYLLVACLMISICVSTLYAADGLSDAEKGIIRLEYIGRQVQAIENELRLYYMAKIEDRPDVAPIGEIEALQKLNKEIDEMNLPQEIADLKPGLKNVINKLLDSCKGILKKNEKIRDKEFGDFWDEVDKYNIQLKSKIDKYIVLPKPQDGFDPLNEEAKLFTNKKDQDIFKKAASFIADRKYKEAADILKPLLAKYKNKPAEGSVLVRIAECYIAKESPLREDMKGDEYVLGLLTDFVNRKQYAFLLQRIYLQWRTLEQMQNNGLSNWSIMPNDQYNQVLWGLVEAIEKYIDQHPDDSWAKYQLLALMDTSMIQRFVSNYPVGNSVALDYAFLSGMLEDEKQNADEKASTDSVKN